jgi:hypothetical protein
LTFGLGVPDLDASAFEKRGLVVEYMMPDV